MIQKKKVTHLSNCFATPLPAFTPFTPTHSLHPFHFTISTPFRVLYLIFCHLCAASFASDSHNDKNSDASIVFTFMPSTCKQLNRMFGGGLWLRHKTAASHVWVTIPNTGLMTILTASWLLIKVCLQYSQIHYKLAILTSLRSRWLTCFPGEMRVKNLL